MVTRTVEVPQLDDGEVDVEVRGLTPLCDAGSVRAELSDSARRVVALRAPLVFPGGSTAPGPSQATLEELGHKLALAQRTQAALVARRDQLLAIRPEPRLMLSYDRATADERIADATAAGRLLDETAAALDTRINQAIEEVRQATRAVEAASLANQQARSSERLSSAHPVRAVTVRLDGQGAVGALKLRYLVPAARWWPVYTLRIAGKSAEWWLEALVAQSSGEDWSAASLSLSTADLISDARLPELPALRLGRAQATPRRGYRPAPAGLDSLFAGYASAFDAPLPPPRLGARYEPSYQDLDDGVAGEAAAVVPAAKPRGRARAAKTMAMAPGAPPAAAAAPMPMPASQAMPADKMVSLPLGGYGGAAPPEPEPADAAPSEDWLDFDRLQLADNSDRTRRGRLVPAARDGGDAAGAAASIETVSAPRHTVDPLSVRGNFDHVFRAGARADVPSDGGLHRIRLADAKGPLDIVYRTAPRETPDVFREAVLKNPFDAPLLAGPVDVYVDNSLLVTTPLSFIDKGGELRLGLGVEDRVKVARRSAHKESSAGLLGGSQVTETEVRIELRSALGEAAAVEVLDRWPVTDDDDLEITLVSEKPKSRTWDQSERGEPLRHGLAFSVELPAGGKSEVAFTYRLQHSAKTEIVGGSRRE
jgi:hypothetical protein